MTTSYNNLQEKMLICVWSQVVLQEAAVRDLLCNRCLNMIRFQQKQAKWIQNMNIQFQERKLCENEAICQKNKIKQPWKQ